VEEGEGMGGGEFTDRTPLPTFFSHLPLGTPLFFAFNARKLLRTLCKVLSSKLEYILNSFQNRGHSVFFFDRRTLWSPPENYLVSFLRKEHSVFFYEGSKICSLGDNYGLLSE
jgi:hypothetical protein